MHKNDIKFQDKFSIVSFAIDKRKLKKLPKPPKPYNYKPAQLRYLRQLLSMTKVLQKLTKELVIPQIKNILANAKSIRPDRADDYSDDIDRLMKFLKASYAKIYLDKDFESLAYNTAADVSKGNESYFSKLNQSLVGIDLARSEPWLNQEIKGFVKDNVKYIKSISEDHFNRLENTLTLGVRQGWQYEEIATEIEDKFGVTENKAKLIARDQVSKFNASLTEYRMKDVGINKYIWQTAGDERVRPEHEANDGQVFSFDDPPITGNPGEDINCRCVAIPYYETSPQDAEE